MISAQPPAVARVVAAARERGVDIAVVNLEQSTRTASEAAAAVGAEVGQIVKSLVFVADHPAGPVPYLALVSGANMVDPAALAAAVGQASVRRATADEVRAATGFAIGGVPPFGHPGGIRTLIDPDLLTYDTVWAAAGTGNSVFPIAPRVLCQLSAAQRAPITRPADAGGTGVPPR